MNGSDRCERRFVERIHHAVDAFEKIVQACEFRGRLKRSPYMIQLTEIGAGAEPLLARAGNDQRMRIAL